MSLVVTGSIGIDSVEAPTGTAVDVLGGSSSYFAAAASFFGPVRMVGVVGDDFPKPFLETLAQFGIDLAGLERRSGSKTFRWSGRYHKNMNQRDTTDVQLNVLTEAPPAIPDAYRDTQYVFLANTDPAIQMALLDQFPDRALAVADTMDLWINTQKAPLLDLLKQIDGLVLNDTEAVQLTGQTSLLAAAESILQRGPKFVVIKKGEHGSILLTVEGTVALPAYPTNQVVDPTGAGDSFAGAMMGQLAQRGELSLDALRQAIAYGTTVASFNVESFSLDRVRQLDREQINGRFEEFRSMLDL